MHLNSKPETLNMLSPLGHPAGAGAPAPTVTPMLSLHAPTRAVSRPRSHTHDFAPTLLHVPALPHSYPLTPLQVHVLDAFNGNKVHRFVTGTAEGGGSLEACFSPDSQYVLSGGC